MGLIHISGANPSCRICYGSGVKPFMGFGMECGCVAETAREEEGFAKEFFQNFFAAQSKAPRKRTNLKPAEPLPPQTTIEE